MLSSFYKRWCYLEGNGIMKTLAVILNHNLPDETNKLYESLKQFEKDDYDLVVVENGCEEDGKSKYSTYTFPTFQSALFKLFALNCSSNG